ncbi:hypothetical protein LTR78_009401 [Recurvomyces mirabilis]|uniref:F-box domain-containing protein n=1 Tax=Recurvomyces mirabilis TaxID=574656 RepID=A0AAE0TNS6_9PEZI|nr:hypothetical protein LTR78_009401 [Recurvomyces mirabilis]KAK5154311.1 hypothetical protein LTS14_006996 [Recurvomyces mirabilis]
MHDQSQSPFFLLPAELREQIYHFSLVVDRPILNAATTLLVPADERDIPPLGLALRRTCRRIYAELHIDVVFSGNDFSFTRPMLASWFLGHLTPAQHQSIRTLIVDLSDLEHGGGEGGVAAGANGLTVGGRWLHYLGCTPTMHDSTRDCMYKAETLVTDLPHIETLVLDIVRLQDLADEAPGLMFDRACVDRLLYKLVVETWSGYEDTSWSSNLRDIVLVGRTNSGRIVRKSIFGDANPTSGIDRDSRRWTHVRQYEKRDLYKTFAVHTNGRIKAPGEKNNVSTTTSHENERGMLSLGKGGEYLLWTPSASNSSLCRRIRMSDVSHLDVRKRPQYGTLGLANLVVVVGEDVARYEFECCVNGLPLEGEGEWYDEMLEALVVAWVCWRRVPRGVSGFQQYDPPTNVEM